MCLIDWSKAKDSDTHYDVLGHVFINFDSMHDYRKILIPRPSSPAWNGEGLPPVGAVCQVQDADGDWHECQIIANHLHNAVFVPHAAYPYGVYDGLPVGRFRPIRTPEQIAAEGREAAIKVMVKLCPYPGSECTRIDCEALYDAGLRFPDLEQPK